MSHWIFAKKTTLWGPSDLADLRAWYKADAITGLSDGDPVSTWSDSSGGGYSLTSSSTARPLYQTNTLAGLPVVEFSGAQWITAATASDWTFLHTAASTIAAVWKAGTSADTNASYGLCGTSADSSANHGMQLQFDDRASVPRNDRIVHATASGGGPRSVVNVSSDDAHDSNAPTLLTCLSDPNNATAAARSSVRVNAGAAIANNTQTITDTNAATYPIQIGALGNNAVPLVGYVAEVVIFDALLSSTDREKVEGYLAHKWGLESNLPAGHPYKNVAPLA